MGCTAGKGKYRGLIPKGDLFEMRRSSFYATIEELENALNQIEKEIPKIDLTKSESMMHFSLKMEKANNLYAQLEQNFNNMELTYRNQSEKGELGDEKLKAKKDMILSNSKQSAMQISKRIEEVSAKMSETKPPC
jgi:hypothetical protein